MCFYVTPSMFSMRLVVSKVKTEIAESAQLQFAIDWFSVVCKFLILNF
jgi:hypothetical protein